MMTAIVEAIGRSFLNQRLVMFCIDDWSDGFSEHGGFPFIGDHDEGSDLHRRCCGARFVGL
jgi:hypothetical protein